MPRSRGGPGRDRGSRAGLASPVRDRWGKDNRDRDSGGPATADRRVNGRVRSARRAAGRPGRDRQASGGRQASGEVIGRGLKAAIPRSRVSGLVLRGRAGPVRDRWDRDSRDRDSGGPAMADRRANGSVRSARQAAGRPGRDRQASGGRPVNGEVIGRGPREDIPRSKGSGPVPRGRAAPVRDRWDRDSRDRDSGGPATADRRANGSARSARQAAGRLGRDRRAAGRQANGEVTGRGHREAIPRSKDSGPVPPVKVKVNLARLAKDRRDTGGRETADRKATGAPAAPVATRPAARTTAVPRRADFGITGNRADRGTKNPFKLPA
jgi:hypothetical protein